MLFSRNWRGRSCLVLSLPTKGRPDAVLTVQERESGEGETRYEIVENGTVLSAVRSLEAATCAVESWAQLTVATLAKELVFVHAGFVGWKDQQSWYQADL